MADVRALSDQEVIELATRKMDPELRYQIENLMELQANGHMLLAEEAEELEDLRFLRDEFLRMTTRAKLEAGMRGLTLPEDDETDT